MGTPMLELRVYYHDTDAGGVVYYANYLKFLEVARTEYMRRRGLDVAEYAAQGILFVVAQAQIDYRSPARYGDVLQIQTAVPQLKRASLIFAHKVINKADQRLIVSAQIKIGCLNSQGKPIPFPPEVKAGLAS